MQVLLLWVLNTIWVVMAVLIFLRFLSQLLGIGSSNPYVVLIRRSTHFVDTFEHILPNIHHGQFSTASLVMLFLLKLLHITAIVHLGGSEVNGAQLLITVIVALLFAALTFFQWLIFGAIIVSWVMALTQNASPLVYFILQLTEPIFAPLRKMLPDTGPIDISPMVAILIVYGAKMFLSYINSVWL